MTNPVRRLVPWWVLALMFVAVPIAEIYLLIQVGQAIGGLWTVMLLLASGVAGAWLVKHEGSRAWRALQDALLQRRMPAKELADGALILIGGTLLLTPGFLTDLVGAIAVLPFTRPIARGVLTRVITRKFVAGAGGGAGGFGAGTGPQTGRRPGTDESVVRGEVIND